VLGDEEVSSALPLGFSFTYSGSAQTTIRVSSNGWLSFSSTTDPTPTPQFFPTSTGSGPVPNNVIAAFWSDLDPSQGGQVHTFSNANDAFVGGPTFTVQFTDVPHVSGDAPVTFQVKFYQATQSFDIRILSGPSDGTPHSIGFENSNGQWGVQIRAGVNFDIEQARFVGQAFATRPKLQLITAGSPLQAGYKTVLALQTRYANGSTSNYATQVGTTDSNVFVFDAHTQVPPGDFSAALAAALDAGKTVIWTSRMLPGTSLRAKFGLDATVTPVGHQQRSLPVTVGTSENFSTFLPVPDLTAQLDAFTTSDGINGYTVAVSGGRIVRRDSSGEPGLIRNLGGKAWYSSTSFEDFRSASTPNVGVDSDNDGVADVVEVIGNAVLQGVYMVDVNNDAIDDRQP
jgi:hypothetical protein